MDHSFRVRQRAARMTLEVMNHNRGAQRGGVKDSELNAKQNLRQKEREASVLAAMSISTMRPLL